MKGESLNITQDNLDKLQTLFPDIFTEGKIDMEKFKATFSDDINFANESVAEILLRKSKSCKY